MEDNPLADRCPWAEFDFSSTDYAEHWRERYAGMPAVAHSSRHGGFWVVSSYAEATRVARDPRSFSSDHDPDGEREGYRGVGIPRSVGTRSLPQEADPPDALFYRRLMNPLFTPAAADRWQPWTEALVDRILSEHLPTGRIDLADDLGFPVPARFTVALLGLPDQDWRRLVDPFHVLVTTPPTDPRYAAAAEGLDAILAELREVIAQRRTAPGGDLLSVLTAGSSGERPLTDDEVLSIAQLMLFGGVDSTTAAFSSAMHWLDEHPDQAERLRGDPALLDTATDEFLRYFSPIHLNGRTVRNDIELGGCALKAGDRLLISWAGANLDPDAVPDADRLVLDRTGVRHLAFGAGVHRCLGANYALMMVKAMLRAVLARIPDCRVDRAGAVRCPSVGQVNGFTRLPAVFAPRPSAPGPSAPGPSAPRPSAPGPDAPQRGCRDQ